MSDLVDGNKPGSLTVVGTGITGAGQTTLEAIACIERAEIVFYSVIEPTTEYWLKGLNTNAHSFSGLYSETKDRRDTYDEMTDRLVSHVRQGARVCAVFYGHPGVFVEASHRAIEILRNEGYSASMMPGVSTDGCFYADLNVNPGQVGMQCFEATEFLLSKRRFDPTSGLLLWQVGVLGETTARRGVCRPERLAYLTETLKEHYPVTHEVVLYFATTFPGRPPFIQRLPLDDLPHASVVPLMTLYVPPLPPRPPVPEVLRWLEEP